MGPVSEERAHPLLLSQTCQARLGMTKRVREGSITLDDHDSQPSEVARQLGTGSFLMRIDHSVHDDYLCNLLLDDLVIDFGAKRGANNVTRGSDKPCFFFDCFTHAMIDDSCRVLPRSVLQADTIIVSCGQRNFECTSWSTQRSHKFGGLHDELTTGADYDKFLESFEDNSAGVCDGRSVWMIDCRKLDNSDHDENPGIHVGRNSRIMRSIFGSKDYHELHSRPNEGISRFFSVKNVVIMICESGRRSSVANAELWSSTLTLYGRYRFTVALVRTRFLEGHVRWKMLGVQQTVCQNFSNTPRLRSCCMFATHSCDRALEATTTGKSRPESRRKQESEIDEYHDHAGQVGYETRNSQRIGGTTRELKRERLCTGRLPTDPRHHP